METIYATELMTDEIRIMNANEAALAALLECESDAEYRRRRLDEDGRYNENASAEFSLPGNNTLAISKSNRGEYTYDIIGDMSMGGSTIYREDVLLALAEIYY